MTDRTAHDHRQPQVVLLRHGQTDWSLTHRHTGRTDIPLNDTGRAEAAALRVPLREWNFARVLVSPLARAQETARIAGLLDRPDITETCDELVEWDYGDYEGMTTAEIRAGRPGWEVFADGCPNGESALDVGARADLVLNCIRRWTPTDGADPAVAVVAHAHLLRVLAARWLGAEAQFGRHIALDSGSLSVVGHERETPVLSRWNLIPHDAHISGADGPAADH